MTICGVLTPPWRIVEPGGDRGDHQAFPYLYKQVTTPFTSHGCWGR